MVDIAIDPDKLALNAGVLWIAPLGTAEPGASGVYPEGWRQIGPTAGGSTDTRDVASADVNVEESFEAVLTAETGVTETLAFNAAHFTAENLIAAMNGGTLTVVGGGVVKVEPPALGQTNPVMISWDSFDGLQRKIYRRCINTGSIAVQRQKAPNYSQLPFSLRVLKPSDPTKKAWTHYFGGALAEDSLV